MWAVRWCALIGLVALSATAFAATFAVELPPQVDAAAAEQLLVRSEVQGGRVIRRYVAGQGWRYVVVVDGLSDLVQARQAGAKLAASGQSATIYAVDGNETSLTEVVEESSHRAPATPPRQEAPKAVEPPAPERSRRGSTPEALANEVLSAAVRAHGGRSGGLERLREASSIQFRYVRTVPTAEGPLIAEHSYRSQGGGLRLEVDVTRGEGQDSVTLLSKSGSAWVVAGGQRTERDGRRTLEVLDRFSPASVLAVPLGLAEDVEISDAWRALRVDANHSGSDGGAVVLTQHVETSTGLVSATFDGVSHTLSRVTWHAEAGSLTFIFDDYRRLDRRLVVPFHARVERDGALVEDVVVLELVLDQPIDVALFAEPAQ